MNSHPNIILESKEFVTALISLGANLSSDFYSPNELVLQALLKLDEISQQKLQASALYETEASDCPPGSPNFVNAVAAICLAKESSAEALLDRLQEIEKEFGRNSVSPINAPRTLDLDLLYFGATVCSSPGLELPHPRAVQRRFVLEPLAEIAPDLILPGQSVPVWKLLESLPKAPWVRKLSNN